MVPEGVINAINGEAPVSNLECWIKSVPHPDTERNPHGMSLLMWAARIGQAEVMKIFLAHGANVNEADDDGDTPLHHAVAITCSCHHRLGAISTLLDHGADVGLRNEAGETPLMGVIRHGTFDSVLLFLSRGASHCLTEDDAEALAKDATCRRHHVADLVMDVRRVGGWQAYVREPRINLHLLRILCERGRACAQSPPAKARVPGTLDLDLVFGSTSGLPSEVFWHIIGFWRSERAYGDGTDQEARCIL